MEVPNLRAVETVDPNGPLGCHLLGDFDRVQTPSATHAIRSSHRLAKDRETRPPGLRYLDGRIDSLSGRSQFGRGDLRLDVRPCLIDTDHRDGPDVCFRRIRVEVYENWYAES